MTRFCLINNAGQFYTGNHPSYCYGSAIKYDTYAEALTMASNDFYVMEV